VSRKISGFRETITRMKKKLLPSTIKSIFLWAFVFLSSHSFGQLTKVRGFVFDGETREPIPFVALSFQGTAVGTITGFNGEYFLESLQASDTLIVSCVGYKSQKIHINQHHYQSNDFYLEADNFTLEEVVIRPGENPAHALLKKIISHKKQNHPDNIGSYSCEIYNKVQVDLNNFHEKLKDRKLMNQLKFVFDHVDTSSLTGKTYLPFLLTESLSDYYYTSKPKKEHEQIKASKVSGLNNESVSEFTGKMYQQMEIYDNFVTVFEPGFVSPIADIGLLYYEYFLIDSMTVGGNWCYKVSFRPKRKMERTFSGYFVVADTSFAIVEAQLRISKDANINFINDYLAILNFEELNDSIWFLTKEKHIVDFTLTNKSIGFFGNKTTSYRKVKISPDMPPEFMQARTNTKVAENATYKNNEFWNENRHLELTKKETEVYEMVDSVKNTKIYKVAYDLIFLLADYYYVIGPFEYGPYYRTFSNNFVEGNRIRLGGRTSNAFSTKLMIYGHGAYGFKDEKFKYGLGLLYMFNKNPRRSMGLSFEFDRRQLGQTHNAFKPDNFMTSFLRRNPNRTLTMVREYKGFYEHEWYQGLSNTITLSHQTIYPVEAIAFEMGDEQVGITSIPNLTNAEITLKTRFAKNEKFLMGEFERVSLSTDRPILEFYLTKGIKGVLDSEFNYFRSRVTLSDKIEINPIGHLKYLTEAGKIFGTLPFPLLELHKGNETWAYDIYAFNRMDYYEFVSDEFAKLLVEQHFQGFFLNRIPLLRKLAWREVVSTKGVIGSLQQSNRKMWNFPDGLTTLSKPYMEAGVGIENIFKLFRIDALWRLTYLNHENIQKFGLRLGMQVIL